MADGGIKVSLFGPKIAKRDYEESSLPSTRREVFSDVVSLHIFVLFFCGVLLLLASLPFAATGIADTLYQANIRSMTEAGELAEGDALVAVTTMRSVLAAVDVIGFLIFGVILSGVAQIIRTLGWEENFRLFDEFRKGVRQNVRQYLVLFLLFGLVQFACRYSLIAGNGFVSWLPAIVCLLLPAPVAAYMLVTITVYHLKFTQQIRYALIIFGKNKLKTFLAILICYLPFAVIVIGKMFLGAILATMLQTLIFFLLPFALLGWFLFAFDRMDHAINRKFYPELVGRGLHLTEYDDDSSWLEA